MDENYYMLMGFCIITNLFWLIMFNISFYKENRWYKEYRKLKKKIDKVIIYINTRGIKKIYNGINYIGLDGLNIQVLLEILKGDNNDSKRDV